MCESFPATWLRKTYAMCLSPISIKNPNYKSQDPYAWAKDTSSVMIRVPCGHCPQCIAVKQMSLVQRVQMESLKSHLFFSTLTYDDKHLPVLVTSNGHEIRYAEIRDLQKMFKRLRKDNAFGRELRYFAVSERGSAKARPHFHILWLIPKKTNDTFADVMVLERRIYDVVRSYWSRNVGTSRKPVYEPLFTFTERFIHGRLKTNYDTHYVNSSFSPDAASDVGFYVLKYMMKSNPHEVRLQQALRLNLPEDEYEHVWALVRSRYVKSHDFGLPNDPDVIAYLQKCIKKSYNDEFPKFYNPATGQAFPLSRFYKSKSHIFTIKDEVNFLYNSKSFNPIDNDLEYNQLVKCLNDYEKKILRTSLSGDSLDFDTLSR